MEVSKLKSHPNFEFENVESCKQEVCVEKVLKLNRRGLGVRRSRLWDGFSVQLSSCLITSKMSTVLTPNRTFIRTTTVLERKSPQIYRKVGINFVPVTCIPKTNF